MTLAGEKKCIPHTFVGRRVARAITLMSSVDVFLKGGRRLSRPPPPWGRDATQSQARRGKELVRD